MGSSDRRIVAARNIEEAPLAAPLGANDTWPAPPLSPAEAPEPAEAADDGDDSDARDTIPTPPPESGTADLVVVPPLREVTLLDDDCG